MENLHGIAEKAFSESDCPVEQCTSNVPRKDSVQSPSVHNVIGQKWEILKDAKDKTEVICGKELFYLSLCLP